MRRSTCCLMLIGMLCAIVGCSSAASRSGVELRGRVLQGGEPIPLDPALAEVAAAYVAVDVQRFDEAGSLVFSTSAQTTQDGSFVIRGLDPGQYLVGVACFNGGPDELFGGRLAAEISGMTVNVGTEPISVEFELDDYLGQARKIKR